MRKQLQRAVLTVFSTILLAILGISGGYTLARAIAFRQAESRLDQSAGRVLAEATASTAESRLVLAGMNSSPYPRCSEADISYLRQLVFASEYLKAGGRMHDGKILCSTTTGVATGQQPQYQPVLSRRDGSSLYRDLPPFRVDHQPVITVQIGDSFVVYDPYNLKTVTGMPIRFALTAVDSDGRGPGQMLGDIPAADLARLNTEGRTRTEESLYATRCSREYATCMTAYMSITDATRGSFGYFLAFELLGGLVGCLLGFIAPFLYSRNKSLEQQLIRAIRADALTVVYQPIVDLATGRIVEAEALVRWTDEYKNPVSPDVFVRIAEERGFVGEITRLVVRHVLSEFASTMRARPGFRVNVNIAASDLTDPDFLPMLEGSLFEAEVGPRNLGIEITESLTARQQVAKEAVLRLRQRGHYVHIDDFGTGYSSLAYLHDLSVDAIKIDKAFTKAIGTDAVTVSILPQILTMAETLKLHVVVEGIETEAQADYFKSCNRNVSIHGQGWLYGRPIPARLFLQVLDEEESRLGVVEQEEEVSNSAIVHAY